MTRVLVTGASGFVGSHLARALIAEGHEVLAMTRHPDDYDGAGEPVYADVAEPESLRQVMRGVQAAYYLVHALDSDDFVQRDADAARAFSAAAAEAGLERIIYLGGLGSERRRAVGPPAVPPRGRAAAGRGRGAGDRAAGGDRDRRRRHLVGDDPAAGQAPAGHGRTAVGDDQDPADRPGRHRPLPGGGAGAGRGPGPDLRGGRPGRAHVRGDDAAGRPEPLRPTAADPDHPAADTPAVVALAVVRDRRRHRHGPQPGRLHEQRGGGHRPVDPRRRTGRAAQLRRGGRAGPGGPQDSTRPGGQQAQEAQGARKAHT